ncbi:MAG TPA: hypothetical protein VG738_01400 [Chitinophagaceae bacterium]|nr:hypothetical protein [Chitinophagaceae bacterium]
MMNKAIAMSVKEYGQPEIEALLAKVRAVKKDIGTYTEHSLTDYGDYMVRLSNGSIRLYPEELAFRNDIFPERIRDISFRFRGK